MTPSASTHPYKHHRFPGEMLSYAVWLYVRLCLSQRDVETGSVTDSCAMTPVAERSACQSGYSKEGSPWDTSHKLYGYSTGCEAEPTSQHDDPRQAWAVIDANDTYQHSNLLRFRAFSGPVWRSKRCCRRMQVWHVLFACIGAVCLTSSRGRQLHGSGLVIQVLLLPWTHNFSQGVEDRCGQPIEETLPCWLCARTSRQYCRSASTRPQTGAASSV